MWRNSDPSVPTPRPLPNVFMKNSSVIRSLVLALSVQVISAGGSGAAQEGPASEAQSLHVLVGKSVVINVEARVRRILVSNPAVIEALATSPTQVVVEAKTSGTSSLVLWDESGRSRLLDVTVDLDVSGLRTAIEDAFPNAAIQVQADGSRVILSGAVPDQHAEDNLLKMANVYSKDVVDSLGRVPVHERQILLEVRFAEVDRTKLTTLAFNLLSTGAGNTLGTTSTQQFSPIGSAAIVQLSNATASTATFGVSNLLNIFLFDPNLKLGTTIQDLASKNVLQILAEPNLLALNGQKASFLAGGEFPFPVVQGGVNVGAVTIQFKPFGVKLDFLGYVEENDVIRVHVAPEVSALDFSNAIVISGFTVPALSTRRAETEIELKDGQSFGIAGLLDQTVTTLLSRVPGISSLPILGQLFRSKSDQRTNTELLVLVTPHIVDPARTGVQMLSVPKPAIPYLNVPTFDKNLPDHKELVNPSPPPTPK